MTTGARHVAIHNKMILGTQDVDERFFQYLRDLIQEGIAAHWNVDGAFDTKLGLAGATNAVSVTGTSLATDGSGHIMDIAQVYPNASAAFENSNGVTYYVGLRYAQVPVGIVINPRTGKPLYQSWQDIIGEAAAPTEVTDNGDGTITFNVNSVTEANVTNAGRKVRVYKNTPADGATTSAIAIEELTVTYNGGTGKNTITTAGALGQDTISTTASHYTVVLMGISVSRNFNLETSPNHMFVGTVAGVGAGGTPIVFNTANQRLLKTFQDASQVIFSPHKWLTASTVQGALELVPDTLERTTNGTAGTNYIGHYTTGFVAKLSGGIGNNADGTFTGASRLSDILFAAEGAIRRRLSWATFADTASTFAADFGHDEFDTVAGGRGGSFYLHAQPNPTTNYYQLASTGLTTNAAPYVHGEASDAGGDPDDKVWIGVPNDASSNTTVIRGAFRRCYFTAAHAGNLQLGGENGSNLIMEDFGIRACYAVIADMTLARPQPFSLRNGVIKPLSGADNGPVGASLSLAHAGSGSNFVHGLIENVIIESPAAAQASPAGTANFTSAMAGVSMGSNLIRPFVFRNCVFRQTRDLPLVILTGTYQYVFENCSFIGGQGYLSTLFQASGGCHVVLRNCYFYAPEGNALSMTGVSGAIQNCFVTTFGNSSLGNTNPQIIRAYGTSKATMFVSNLEVEIAAGAIRGTGSATNPLVHFGLLGSSRSTVVNGLHVRYADGQTQAHRAPSIAIEGHSTSGNSFYSNIVLDLNGLARNENSVTYQGYASIFNVTEARASNIAIVATGNPGAALNASILSLYQSQVDGARVYGGTAGGIAARWYAMVQLDVESQISDLVMEGGTVSAEKGYLYSGTSGNCRASNVRFNGITPGTGTVAYVYIESPRNRMEDIEFVGGNVSRCPLLMIEGDSNSVRGLLSDTSSTTAQAPVQIVSGQRRNWLSNLQMYWNGTSTSAVLNDSDDGFVTDSVFRRTTGASAAIENNGANFNITVNNILSTV